MGDIVTTYQLQDFHEGDKSWGYVLKPFMSEREAVETMVRYAQAYGSDTRAFRVVKETREVVAEMNDVVQERNDVITSLRCDWFELWTPEQAEKELNGRFKFNGPGFYPDNLLVTHENGEVYRFQKFSHDIYESLKFISSLPCH